MSSHSNHPSHPSHPSPNWGTSSHPNPDVDDLLYIEEIDPRPPSTSPPLIPPSPSPLIPPQPLIDACEELNNLLHSNGVTPYKLAVVSPLSLIPAPLNAHYMDPATLATLTQNIRNDGNLASLPFCWRQVDDSPPSYLIISGHHRVQAAQDAEI